MHWDNLAQALGSGVGTRRPVAGGDICQAFAVDLSDGRRVFVKTRAAAPAEFFAAEARGLNWLAETGALDIPEVLAVGPDFLALEWIDSAPAAPDFDLQLGRGLAALHAFAPDGQVLEDNFIGPLPQSNRSRESWATFWIEERLRPLLRRLDPPAWKERFEDLFRELPGWMSDEPLSRLHGDLWRGNVMVGPRGQPVLVDPACYPGHREVDLAMMDLFGGFSARVLQTYQSVLPLSQGWQRRRQVYQLYPLMVHALLFGGSYFASVEACLQGLLRH